MILLLLRSGRQGEDPRKTSKLFPPKLLANHVSCRACSIAAVRRPNERVVFQKFFLLLSNLLSVLSFHGCIRILLHPLHSVDEITHVFGQHFVCHLHLKNKSVCLFVCSILSFTSLCVLTGNAGTSRSTASRSFLSSNPTVLTLSKYRPDCCC